VKKILLFPLLIALILCACVPGLSNNERNAPAPAALNAIPVARVNSFMPDNNSFHGSGIIIDKSGVILTAYHCLHKKATLCIGPGPRGNFTPARPLPGKIFPDNDVAFIKADGLTDPKTTPLYERKYDPNAFLGSAVCLKGHKFGHPRKIIIGRVCSSRMFAGLLWLQKIIHGSASLSHETRLAAREANNLLFVKINDRDIAGMSGGAIIIDGQAIAMIIAQFNALGGTYAVGVPIYRCLELYHQP